MKLIGYCEGAAVYAAEHVIMPREHGGSLEVEAAASVRKYEKNVGSKPIVVLTGEQVRKLKEQSAEAEARHARETKRARERGKPLPEPLPPPAVELEPEALTPAPQPEESEPAPVEPEAPAEDDAPLTHIDVVGVGSSDE